jgi:hypothetical protein
MRTPAPGALALPRPGGGIANIAGTGFDEKRRRCAPPTDRSSRLSVFRTGGIMNPTIELLLVFVCWLGVFAMIAAIISLAIEWIF